MHKCVLLVGLFVLVSVPAAAQVPRTPWGDPDLQGTWDFTTITPLQRPPELAGKAFLTESEAAALEKQINQQRVQTEEVSPGSGWRSSAGNRSGDLQPVLVVGTEWTTAGRFAANVAGHRSTRRPHSAADDGRASDLAGA